MNCPICGDIMNYSTGEIRAFWRCTSCNVFYYIDQKDLKVRGKDDVKILEKVGDVIGNNNI